MPPKPSILRGKYSNSSKGNVSFSDKKSVSRSDAVQNEERYHSMNDDEEDAFDPQTSGIEINEERRIRDARSKRALERIAGGDEFETGSGGQSTRGLINGGFDGEEQSDSRYSLLHDPENMKGENNELCPIEPFNMNAEREDGEGYFDGDTYVFRRNRDEGEEDAWLDNLDDEKLTHSDGMASFALRRSDNSDTNTQDDNLTKDEIYLQIIELLGIEDETVIQALGRYGNIIKRERKNNNDASNPSSSAKRALDRLTELSNLMMMKFEENMIYEKSKKDILESLNSSSTSISKKRGSYFDSENDESVKEGTEVKKRKGAIENATEPIMWAYKGNQDNEIHGPYTSRQMLDWINAGYFVGAMAVDVYKVDAKESKESKEENNKKEVDDLLGDLEDSDDDSPSNENKNIEWMRSDQIDFSSYI